MRRRSSCSRRPSRPSTRTTRSSGRAALARDEASAMSRRRGDQRTLGTILAASYWARGSSSNEEINRMLVEAREIGTELEDVEIEGAALSWLVPSYVVL